VTIGIGGKYGHWRIVNIRGRAVTAICRCGTTKVLSLDAIESGDAPPSCGCAPLSRVERGKTIRGATAAERRAGNSGHAERLEGLSEADPGDVVIRRWHGVTLTQRHAPTST
jgi:hypothetical protein